MATEESGTNFADAKNQEKAVLGGLELAVSSCQYGDVVD
jgi:hypothetical protein